MSAAPGAVSVGAIQVGDCVRLKSGGPAMSVYDIDYWGDACCNWLVGAELRAATFPPVCLEDAGVCA